MTILVVDDTKSTRVVVSYIVEDIGHVCVSLASGQEAIDYVKTCSELPLLIVMDVQMPGVDGYQAARAIKDLLKDRHIPIVFLTASEDAKALETCLAIGDDYVKKPFDSDVLMARVSAHLRTSALYRQLDNQAAELRKYRAGVEAEQRIINRIFESHLSGNSVDLKNLRMHMSPMSAFNGDVLLSALGPSGSCYIMIGDVTGHGLPAAVAGIPSYGTFQTMAMKGLPVGTIAYELNAGLRAIMPADMMMAALVMEIDNSGLKAKVWSGGMPPMVVVNKEGKITQRIHSKHMPLSVMQPEKFNRDIQIFDFDLGDKIYLFTDGVEEASDVNGNMLGEEAMLDVLTAADDPFQSLLDRVEAFRSGSDQNDDVSLVEFVCQPIDICMTVSPSKVRSALPWRFRSRLTYKDFDAIDPVPLVSRMLSGATGLELHQDAISTVLSELYANALDHGILGLDSSLKEKEDGFIVFYEEKNKRIKALTDGWIEIAISCRVCNGGIKVNLCVQDTGVGFKDSVLLENSNNNQKLSGRGIDLIRSLCDSLKYSEGGAKAEVQFIIS